MRKSFLELFGTHSINDLIGAWQPVVLDPQREEWVGFPPIEFIEFLRKMPRTSFDGIPPSPAHIRPPSFYIAQAHRIWLTSKYVWDAIQRAGAKRLLDLGSFPFAVPIVIRDFFGFRGDILATSNIALDERGLAFLNERRIDLTALDLDPFVNDPQETTRLPSRLQEAFGTFDIVLASHVIEHLYHPMCLLDESSRILAPDGLMVLTTDNAMMLEVFANYVGNHGFIFEPVTQTAAMTFGFWRGHVRFFTETDLRTMIEKCGLEVVETRYWSCIYEVLFPEYFADPEPKLQEWKLAILRDYAQYRNDIALTAVKRG